jgi:hypothetical protein
MQPTLSLPSRFHTGCPSGAGGTFLWIAAILFLIPGIVGCGKAGPSLVPVKGSVTVDGKPADGAVLIFHPTGGKGTIASAAADSNGAFSITSNGAPGVVTGSYKVTATWPDPAKKPKVTLGASPEDAPDLLEGRYVSVDKSPTTVEITAATKELPPIELSTK